MPERDDLDRLIDSELARYAEPRTGLEQRILARISAQGAARSLALRQWHRWALAGAVAALAIATLVVSPPRIAHHKTGAITAHKTSPDDNELASRNQTPETHIVAQHLKHTAKRAENTLRNSRSLASPERVQRPKYDVFPSPQPLSKQEQSLVEVAASLPEGERERLFSGHDRQDAPLEISSIKIPLITVPDLGKK